VNNYEILYAIGDIDDYLIERADPEYRKPSMVKYVYFGAAAACILIMIFVLSILVNSPSIGDLNEVVYVTMPTPDTAYMLDPEVSPLPIPTLVETATAVVSLPTAHTQKFSTTITTDISWTAKSNVNWLTLSSSGGTGNAVFTINALENESTSQRTGVITITYGTMVRTIIIKQEGWMTGNTNFEEPALSPSPIPSPSLIPSPSPTPSLSLIPSSSPTPSPTSKPTSKPTPKRTSKPKPTPKLPPYFGTYPDIDD